MTINKFMSADILDYMASINISGKFQFLLVLASLLLVLMPNSAFASKEIHEHKSRVIEEGVPIPKIELKIFRDAMDGVNVHVKVKNYVLNAPDMATSLTGLSPEGLLQGHAHVFVNAQKRRRLYGSDIHIPQSWLQEGVNQIAISLNSHEHENWVAGKHAVMSSIFFDLSKDPIELHNFSSQPMDLHKHH